MTAAHIAANKFGLGLRPGELTAVAADPRGWLKRQLAAIDRMPPAFQQLPSTESLIAAEAEVRRDRRRVAGRNSPDPQARQERLREERRRHARQRQAQSSARLQAAIGSEQPFAERLVRFWSNHFTVAAAGGAKAILQTIAIPYENEAIRAHLSGDFASLLLAVERHPAMLIYLDNDLSVGPNSTAGTRRGRGLNENLAREILELHTLGVDGGYTQDDVTSLARIITGWTVARGLPGPASRNRRGTPPSPGRFRFSSLAHEPGNHYLLGLSYRQRGVEQGARALADLARHPATARHIAAKLVRHFVADEPPPDAVATLERVFMDSNGSLPTLHEALVDLDAAWDPRRRKLKTPEELVVSTARALDIGSGVAGGERVTQLLVQALGGFNQSPFTAPSPAGWPDEADYWGSPDAMLKRIEWANQVAERSAVPVDPLRLSAQVLPESEALQRAVSRAESRQQGLALLLAGPDFQWR